MEVVVGGSELGKDKVRSVRGCESGRRVRGRRDMGRDNKGRRGKAD